MDLKKNGWKQTLSPPTPPPVEGRIQVDRREERKTQREMVAVGRDLKGRETRVRRWMRDRFLQNNFIFIYLSIVVILFIFLSVNCLLLIFFFV